ncbi:uncharacterized protein LACBIDRAFT_316668 [Laccaria bicolor S238N-H82]|uniref:Predicted protein n=1 Tax=Laccaria bicolor (strain S238N-H82 / ATCC MYA-4686) TaxID=486041 RepID=B0E1D8_LACBS|nr:uncharacterized protein LACBIDRAFT_316668 [Laccaria bicolor S238N-H82]EDQ99348.1 predicted protein [Laccaria bicolor S238N-H82]|eukprot:XP_001889994.1 predicted protein [Laccaria bicolor S238N-H82]
MFRALSTSLSPKPPCLPRGVAQREALALRLQKSAFHPSTSSNRSNFRLDRSTLDDKPSQSSQLSPSESLYLQVRFRGLFRAASKSKIPLDELLSKVGPHFSGKQEWSKSFDKFDVVLKFSRYAGVCALLPQTQKRPPNAGAIDLRML